MKENKSKSHKSTDFKLKVVLDLIENERSVVEVAKEIGVHRETVYNWRKAYLLNGEDGLKNLRSINHTKIQLESKEIIELKKKLKEKEMENEILKKFQAFLKGNV